MISILEKRYALRKELRADLDSYLKLAKQNPDYRIDDELQEIVSRKIRFYGDLTQWFYKATMEVKDPTQLRVFHLRYNMGFEFTEIADSLGLTPVDVELILGQAERDFLRFECFK
ncbi:TPA: hypothetical protein ACSYUM_13765 [Listeria monocytogenes]|nr:hypothetical protein [Listeria monocytogenes]EHG1717813.1 hypothetical protein [Listeria monocytogenes]EHG1796790.1 hypothetical protein [Listeria monocytogenes]